MIDVLAEMRIGVVMGGLSAEKEVSMTSGGAVENALRDAGYDVFPIHFTGPGILEQVMEDPPDVVFIALHGRYGEDGTVQGFFETAGIPYTGSGVLGSALAMDKAVTKQILKFHGIPTADFSIITRGGGEDAGALAGALGYPLVVKPSSLGSTIGLSVVRSADALADAVSLAFRHDDDVLLEKFVPGREITVGVLNGGPLPPVEIVAPGGIYDYEAKYESHDTRYICPAEIDVGLRERLNRLAVMTYRVLKCRGAGRVDFRVDEGGEPYVLELNTIPGMTPSSLLPKAAASAGMDFVSLVEAIILEAVRR